MRKRDKDIPCHIRHPDVSFWAAVGHHDGSSNARKLWPNTPEVGGVWKSREEYDKAWTDHAYSDREDYMKQTPVRPRPVPRRGRSRSTEMRTKGSPSRQTSRHRDKR